MLRQIKYITKIQTYFGETHYLFCKTNQTLLPIETNNRLDDSETYSIKLIVKALGSEVAKIKIYKYLDGHFYTYLTLTRQNGREFDVNVGPTQALSLCDRNIPVYSDDSILQECGVKVTNELIKEALGLVTN